MQKIKAIPLILTGALLTTASAWYAAVNVEAVNTKIIFSTAAHVTDKEGFQEALLQSANIFAYGTLKALYPVKSDCIKGEYGYLITDTLKLDTEENEWYLKNRLTESSTAFSFFGETIPTEDIEFPEIKMTKEEDVSYISKNEYRAMGLECEGTLYVKTKNGKISKAKFFEGMSMSEAIEHFND